MDKDNKNLIPEEDSLFTDDIVKGFLIVVGIIGVFVLGLSLFGSEKAPDTDVETSVAVQQTVVTTQAVTAAPTTAAPVVTTTAPAVNGEEATTVPSVNTEATTAPAPSGQKSVAEIIALFNESANKVKTDAVKVVKNYEYRTHNEDKLVLPSVLEGMFNELMGGAMSDDTEPIEYPTREDIIANYPVPGESWASQLTEAEVAEASCTDNGTEYEIMMKLHPTTNPEPGIGIAKAFDCITASEVSASAPSFVESFSTEYYDCVVKCRIDKATGRTVWSNYSSPVVINAVINMGFTKLDAQVGFTFEKDYTITY